MPPEAAQPPQSRVPASETEQAAIEAADLGDDLGDDDASPSSGAGAGSTTASLSESIFAYRELYGRTYNATGGQRSEHWAPNDETQQKGLDLLHNAFAILFNGSLFLAPVRPTRVLDVGCGTGIWTIDCGDAFPDAQVTGIDLSPIQPRDVPPNVKFEVDDCNLDWTWPDDHFDLVFMRMLNGSIPNYTDFYRKALKHMQPGGWFESHELDHRVHSDYVQFPPRGPTRQWYDLFLRVGEVVGCDFMIGEGHKLRDAMTEAGFVDVHECKHRLPLSDWPLDRRLRHVGMLAGAGFSQSLEGYALHSTTQVLGMTLQETLILCAAVRRECLGKRNCTYCFITVVCGRKPSPKTPRSEKNK